MNSKSLCLWLADVEDALWRMTAGVFRFVFHRLPEWIYRTLLEIVGPVVVRAVRVLAVLCLWLAVLLWPAFMAGFLTRSAWGFVAAVTWLSLAASGSVWGLYYLKKRRAAAMSVEAERVTERRIPPRGGPVAVTGPRIPSRVSGE